MVDLRDMTAAEKKWWKELRAVLGRMPKYVELHARFGGEIGIAPLGSRDRAFKESRYGDLDSVCEYEWDDVAVPRLDGRDSHL
ncbi:MAG: hypothetical protein VB101_07145 [Rhodospirillaceae bacterium]|nr:hypothetical protein [Rhodospirillaceae bacterium]